MILDLHSFSIDVSAYPTISRIIAACQQLSAVRDAHPSRQVDAE